MIILDEPPSSSKLSSYSDVAGPTLRFPDRVAGRSSTLTLPDYETSQALAQSELSQKNHVKKKVDSRFWRATLYALIIYIVLSIVIGVPIVVTKMRHARRGFSPPPPGPPWHAGFQVSGPSSSMSAEQLEGATQMCNSWVDAGSNPSGGFSVFSQSHTASSRGEFSIRSNVTDDSGAPQHIFGDLTVRMNPDKKAKDAVLSIIMESSSAAVSKDTNVCFSKTDAACDLAIYVPGNLGGSDSLRFNITLLFPNTANPSTVAKLATWLPTFPQSFGYMDKQLTFSKATIEGGSSKFDAGYLQATDLLVKTAMSEINGDFRVNGSLTLDTVEAPINVSITLVNSGKHHVPTVLNLDTGNGEIDANVHLLGFKSSDHHRNTFFTSAKTFNAPLKFSVTHDDSTPPSEFRLRAQNNLAKTHIILDPKYEGTFDLQTKLASATIQDKKEKAAADPLGHDRLRSHQIDHQSSSRTFGWVGWGSRPSATTRKYHQGHVEVTSSHSPVLLQLDGAESHDMDKS